MISSELFHKIGLGQAELIKYNANPLKTLSNFTHCDAFICMKLHSAVFAYMADIPFLIIDYLPKCNSFAKEIGMEADMVLSLDDIFSKKLSDAIWKMTTIGDRYIPKVTVEENFRRLKESLSVVVQEIKAG
jgi:polysaccharide pyruvyl transferase WcaK-like protein